MFNINSIFESSIVISILILEITKIQLLTFSAFRKKEIYKYIRILLMENIIDLIIIILTI